MKDTGGNAKSVGSTVVESQNYSDETNTSTGANSSAKTDEAKTGAPKCTVTYYQIDLVRGEPIEKIGLQRAGTYMPDELIRFAHGNTNDGVTRRSEGEFVTDEAFAERIKSQNITVDNGTAVTTFTITEGEPVTISLVSYEKPGPGWSRQTENLQDFVGADSRTVGPGTYTFSVPLPDPCLKQPSADQPDTDQPDQPDTDQPDQPDTDQPDQPDTDQPAEQGIDTPDQSDGPDTGTPDQPNQPETETPDQPDELGTDTPDQPSVHDTDTPDQPDESGLNQPDEPGTDTPDQPDESGTDTPVQQDQPETETSDQPDEPATDTPEQPPEEPPEQAADLSLTKSVNRSTSPIGSTVAYTITVENNGPDAASGVTVEDTLPEEIEFVSASATQGSYNADTGLWTVGTIEAGTTETLTIVVTVGTTENIRNVAEINSSDTFDPDSTPNNDNPTEDDQASVTINGQSADLAVNKTVVAGTNATVGETVTFNVTVTNTGPDTATNVSVEERLGAGYSFQSASTTQGSYNVTTNTYNVGTLAPGETATLTLTVTVETVGNTTNTVQVTSETPDPNQPNNNVTVNPTPAVADLSLTKTVNKSAPKVSGNITYTLTVTNSGPSAASNVTVTEALPDGVAFVNANATQGSYDADTGLWTVGTVEAGATETLTIVVTVETTEDIRNVAEINSSDTFDSDSTPNNDNPDEDDQASVTINGQSSDLTVTKTVETTNATVGDNVTFTVEVTNTGPDTATNVSVTEMLGEGYSFQNASVTQGEYNTTTNIYSVGTLAPNETAILTLTATIESVENTTNAVQVTSETPDLNPSNNNDSTNPTPAVADLTLTKNVSESTPNVGENVTYTLTVTNAGPNAASNVTVAEVLPDGVTFVRAETSQGRYDPTSGLWSVGDIASNDTATLTIVATVESTEDIRNVAEINSSDTFDPDSTPDNNDTSEDDQASITINGQSADLAVNKSVVEGTNATVGETVTFNVTVTNTGPDTATNVTVNESLGSGLAFQSASATQGEYNEATSIYSVGTLEPGETATLTLTARIESTDNITNVVEVTSETHDPNDSNNNDSATPSPEVADLSLDKSVNDTTLNVGENVEYTVTLSNTGPANATNVTVTEALPDGLTFVSADANQGSYDADTGIWTVGNIDSNDTATLTIVATVESTDDITNVAEVHSSDTFDPDSTPDNDNPNEDDQASVTINGQSADLAVNKTIQDGMGATVGETVTFNVTVTNTGPDMATNVTVNEMLGDGLAFQSASVTQGEYDESTSVYTVGTLRSGETATLTLTAKIVSAENTTNTVVVMSETPDQNEANNNDSVTLIPDAADLSLTKTVSESTPSVDENVTYTLTVTNNGPNTTSNVKVSDTLPEGVAFVSADPSQGTYDVGTGVWSIGTIEAGTTETLTIVATVKSTKDVKNVAEVTSSSTADPDSTPDNNDTSEDDQASVTIHPTEPQCEIQLGNVTAPESVKQGQEVTIEATVSNTGLKNDCGATAALNVTGNSTRAVDIVFLVDTSASTGPIIQNVINKLGGFATTLDNQNISARYAVISYGYRNTISLDQRYTSDSSEVTSTLRNLETGDGLEENYEAINVALTQLNPRPNANVIIIDVTNEDADTQYDRDSRFDQDPDLSQTEIGNRIDNAGATFIAVSPDPRFIADRARRFAPRTYEASQDIRVLANEVQDGFEINLYTDVDGDGFSDRGELNNFVDKFEDIVIQQVEQGITRKETVTLDAKESKTLSFTVDTSSYKVGTDITYTVTVGGETQTGTITITGSGSSLTTTNAASFNVASSSTLNTASQDTANEKMITTEMTEVSGENTPKTTATQTSTAETRSATTETETKTLTDDPTETATTTVDTTTETTTTVNTTVETPSNATDETPSSTVNETSEMSGNTETETPTEVPPETATATGSTTTKTSPSTTSETPTTTMTKTTTETGETPTEPSAETTEPATATANTTTTSPTTKSPTVTNESAETSPETNNTAAAR